MGMDETATRISICVFVFMRFMVHGRRFSFSCARVCVVAVLAISTTIDKKRTNARPRSASFILITVNSFFIVAILYLLLVFTMDPLTTGQQLFNQRLLAEHCLAEKDAVALWEQLGSEEGHDMGGKNLAQTVSSCNAQLHYCGLEIRCVSMKQKTEEGGANGTVKYYAIVNQFPDEVAQKSFKLTMNLGEQAFIKVVLEHLVDGPQTQATLVNLRSSVEGDHELSLKNSELALMKLINAKWIEWSGALKYNNNAEIQLAPRAYMELSQMLLQEFGMDKENLPQVIVH
jgi:hypothetical protein